MYASKFASCPKTPNHPLLPQHIASLQAPHHGGSDKLCWPKMCNHGWLGSQEGNPTKAGIWRVSHAQVVGFQGPEILGDWAIERSVTRIGTFLTAKISGTDPLTHQEAFDYKIRRLSKVYNPLPSLRDWCAKTNGFSQLWGHTYTDTPTHTYTYMYTYIYIYIYIYINIYTYTYIYIDTYIYIYT